MRANDVFSYSYCHRRVDDCKVAANFAARLYMAQSTETARSTSCTHHMPIHNIQRNEKYEEKKKITCEVKKNKL